MLNSPAASTILLAGTVRTLVVREGTLGRNCTATDARSISHTAAWSMRAQVAAVHSGNFSRPRLRSVINGGPVGLGSPIPLNPSPLSPWPLGPPPGGPGIIGGLSVG